MKSLRKSPPHLDYDEPPRSPTGRLILDGRYGTPSEVRAAADDPSDLANVGVLRQIFIIWEKDASREDWIWLAERLSNLLDTPGMDSGTWDINLSPLLHSLIAFSLVQQTAGLTLEQLDLRRELALLAIQKYTTCRSILSSYSLPIPPLPVETSLIGLVYARLDDFPAAQEMFFKSIYKDLAKRRYPMADIRCLQMYHDILLERNQMEDLVDIISNRFRTTFPIMLQETLFQSKRPELCEVFFRAIRNLEDPRRYFRNLARRDIQDFKAKGGKMDDVVVTEEEVEDEGVGGKQSDGATEQGTSQDRRTHMEKALEKARAEDDEKLLDRFREEPDWENLSEEEIDRIYDDYNRVNDVDPLDPPEELVEYGPAPAPPVKKKRRKLKVNPYSPRTRWTGSLMFIALARQPHDPLVGFQWMYRLFRLNMWISPHHAADLGVMLAQQNRHHELFQVYRRLNEAHHQLSLPVMKRFLYLLLQFGFFTEAGKLQRRMVNEYGSIITDKDKMIYVRSTIHHGLITQSLEGLRAVYGEEEFRTNPESLQWTLRLFAPRSHNARYKERLEQNLALLKELAMNDTRSLNILLGYYADRSDVNSALLTFNEVLSEGGQPDIDTFAALIRMFSKLSDMRNVDRMVQAAIESRQTLTGEFCATVLNAGIKAQDYLTVARRYAAFPDHIKSHPEVVAAVLRAFVFLAVPFDFVLRFFRQIAAPTVHQWQSIILSACDTGRMDVVDSLVKEMYARNAEISLAPRPDAYIYTSIMHAYLRLGEKDRAKDIYDEMRNRCLAPTGMTYSMIFSSYIQGRPDGSTAEQANTFAMSVHNMAVQGLLPDRGDALSNVPYLLFGRLITLSGRLKRWEDAQRYYDLAARSINGFKSTIQLKTALLQAYRMEGISDKVLELWNEIYLQAQQQTGLDPNNTFAIAAKGRMSRSNILCIPLSITLDALGSAGRYDDMVKVWQTVHKAGFGVDASNWNHYAIALARSGDLEAAFWIVDRVLLRRWKQVLKRSKKALRENTELEQVNAAAEKKSPTRLVKDEALRYRMASQDGVDPMGFQSVDEYPEDRLPFTLRQIRDTDQSPVSPSDQRPSKRAEYQRERKAGERSANLAGELVSDPAGELDMSVVTRQILLRYRAGDQSWQPSRLLQSVLSSAYGELQLRRHVLQKNPNAIAPTVSRDHSGQGHIVTLSCFDDAPIRGKDGVPKYTTPRAIIGHLAHLYPKVVSLITRFREKQDRERYLEAEEHLELLLAEEASWYDLRRAANVSASGPDNQITREEKDQLDSLKAEIEAAKRDLANKQLGPNRQALRRKSEAGAERVVAKGIGLSNRRRTKKERLIARRVDWKTRLLQGTQQEHVSMSDPVKVNSDIAGALKEEMTLEEMVEEIKRIEESEPIRPHLSSLKNKSSALEGTSSEGAATEATDTSTAAFDDSLYADPSTWSDFVQIRPDLIHNPTIRQPSAIKSRFPLHAKTKHRNAKEGMYIPRNRKLSNPQQLVSEQEKKEWGLLYTPELWDLREETRRQELEYRYAYKAKLAEQAKEGKDVEKDVWIRNGQKGQGGVE